MRDDFQQPEVTRRIEEMRAKETLLEAFRQTRGDLVNGNAGCIAADDGIFLDKVDGDAPSARA